MASSRGITVAPILLRAWSLPAHWLLCTIAAVLSTGAVQRMAMYIHCNVRQRRHE
eukprot:CAMPEP_0114607952 /NCGR_PEP_ID=MMETSP0168-20121206/2329_1 /TAXON_ID=95228 ORGANISM="Vannella sp., Strain DIVA3 517/6/12" /NCGR_SAMPLE_ID=MMETSP0168 /ASSEMBLY_ACC=CAM_ASM_000044 /LENGTH=54 /DNA_ID=CAMNT_0001818837 /DNA_START=130 /DNA_END=294 /DNA_ORIENTATION=-